jgi:hypothetical protein
MTVADIRPTSDPVDPKGLIREAFRIDGITEAECRSIFVDWALSVAHEDPRALIETLIARHGADAQGHPMLAVLTEGLAAPARPRRRGGWSGRRRKD